MYFAMTPPNMSVGYESSFVVPEVDRKPVESVKEFYKNQDKIIHKYLVDTRAKFTNQPFVGSVMMGGFHILMPENAKWQNHILEISSDLDASENMPSK
jgi:hypothetical protein